MTVIELAMKLLSFLWVPLLFMTISCENDLATIKSLTANENTPLSSTYEALLTHTDSGLITFKLQSPEINQFKNAEEEYMEMPKGVHITFFDSLGHVKSELSAQYAINKISQKRMEAKNNVVAVNSKGQQLYTEQLIWDQNSKQIYTHTTVKVVTGNKILFGEGMVSDEQFQNWEILKPRGDIEVNSFNSEDSIK